jgi:4-hydroxybutyrate CoA-transferase
MGRFVNRYLEDGMEEHVRCVTPFAGGVHQIVRLLNEGRADFYPIPLSMLPWLFRSGSFKPDVFIATVSPPDQKGDCSLGVSVDYGSAALETAKLKIAEVNPNMPRTLGESKVHISLFDLLVEASDPLYEMPRATITNLDKSIGEKVASLVEDEATIQIGFGAVAESIPHFLKEKRDLGMHSEMFPESAVALVEEGILTGEKKSLNKRKVVCAFSGGSRRLYDWLNENPAIAFRPLDYTNDSRLIAMNHKMTAINTALQVDLYGNVYSDMLGCGEYSGAGGQPDFVFGSMLCPKGRSIIALPSTASNGTVSRIVAHPAVTKNRRAPMMPTVSRFNADYVVTEEGIAALKGKTVKERAKVLIEIAHPNFKDSLWEDARKIGLFTG